MSVFLLADKRNNTYLKHNIVSNKYVPVHNQALAEAFSQRNRAQHVLEHNVSKKLRKRYKVIEIDTKPATAIHDNIDSQQQTEQNGQTDCKQKSDMNFESKTVSKNDFMKAIAAEPIEKPDFDKLYDDITHVIDFLHYVSDKKVELLQAMSNIDKELEDIKHYIEFNKFNAYSGWLALNMERQRLMKRRQIKNELQAFLYLDTASLNEDMLQATKLFIDKSQNREYCPRMLPELFDNKSKKDADANGQS